MILVKHNIFFSVVIPVFNRRNFLPRTLNSVLSQTFNNFEIIAIDNCSTDGSWEILKQYSKKHPQIRAYQNEHNKERAFSRNRGMELAEGKFITFLDSDDLMKPSCLSDAYHFHRSHPELKIFHNKNELRDVNLQLLYRFRVPSLRNRFRAIMKGNFLSCAGVFLHREIYTRETFRFDENPNLIGSEDYELWIRVLAYYQLGRINKYNTIIIHHGSRTVNKQASSDIIKRARIIFKKILEDQHLFKVYAPYLNLFWASRYILASYTSLENQDVESALTFLRKAIYTEPSIIFDRRFWSLSLRLLKQIVTPK